MAAFSQQGRLLLHANGSFSMTATPPEASVRCVVRSRPILSLRYCQLEYHEVHENNHPRLQ